MKMMETTISRGEGIKPKRVTLSVDTGDGFGWQDVYTTQTLYYEAELFAIKKFLKQHPDAVYCESFA
jgi:hypothetical protein